MDYSLHNKNLSICNRCYVSTRPPCSSCGHALCGQIDPIGYSVCEVCGVRQFALPTVERTPMPQDGYTYIDVTAMGDTKQVWLRSVKDE